MSYFIDRSSGFDFNLISFILTFFIYRNWLIKKLAKSEVAEKNRLIAHQKKEIEDRIQEIEDQAKELKSEHELVIGQQKELTDSITYARRIQHAILPTKNYLKKVMPEYFILYKARDIVSGDFYWIKEVKNYLVVIAADCTGHGVPCAFMSMLCIAYLNEIIF